MEMPFFEEIAPGSLCIKRTYCIKNVQVNTKSPGYPDSKSRQSLGINLSQVLIVRPPQLTQFDSTFITRESALQNELKRIPNVRLVANSWSVPGNEMGRDFDLSLHGGKDEDHFTTRKNGVSPEYIPVYDIKLLAGRNFDNSDYNSDWKNIHNIILNENVTRLLGFKTPQEAIGKQIHVEGRQWDVVGSFGVEHCFAAFKRFHQAGAGGFYHCFTGCLADHE